MGWEGHTGNSANSPAQAQQKGKVTALHGIAERWGQGILFKGCPRTRERCLKLIPKELKALEPEELSCELCYISQLSEVKRGRCTLLETLPRKTKELKEMLLMELFHACPKPQQVFWDAVLLEMSILD